jgi:plasmid stability protein
MLAQEAGMGQILIRNLSDEVMRAFKARARRRGRSQEQEARMLVEEAAREEQVWADFLKFADRMRERLRARGKDFGDSTREIRRSRDRGHRGK